MKDLEPKKQISKDQIVNKFLLKKRIPEVDSNPEKYLSGYNKRLKSTTDLNLKAKLTPRVSEEVNCPICLCPILNVQSTLCGHSFCHNCIFEHFLSSKKCPMCRNFIKNLKTVKCKNYEWAIKNYTHHNKELEKRQTEYKTWKNDWKLTEIFVGQKIDARDTCHVWCEAIILDKIQHKSQCATLLIHYINWNCVYDEFIGENSPRLAKFKSFTGRSDIPRYSKSRDNQDIYTNVLFVPHRDSNPSPPNPPQQYQPMPRPISSMYPYPMPPQNPLQNPPLQMPMQMPIPERQIYGYPQAGHWGMYQRTSDLMNMSDQGPAQSDPRNMMHNSRQLVQGHNVPPVHPQIRNQNSRHNPNFIGMQNGNSVIPVNRTQNLQADLNPIDPVAFSEVSSDSSNFSDHTHGSGPQLDIGEDIRADLAEGAVILSSFVAEGYEIPNLGLGGRNSVGTSENVEPNNPINSDSENPPRTWGQN